MGRDRGNESTSPSCSARSGSSVRRATSIGDRGDGFSPVNLIPSWCKSSSSRTAAVPSRLRGRTTRSTNAILSSTTSSAWRPPVRGSGSRPSATRCVTSSRNDGFTPRKYAGSEHCGPRRGLGDDPLRPNRKEASAGQESECGAGDSRDPPADPPMVLGEPVSLGRQPCHRWKNAKP